MVSLEQLKLFYQFKNDKKLWKLCKPQSIKQRVFDIYNHFLNLELVDFNEKVLKHETILY